MGDDRRGILNAREVSQEGLEALAALQDMSPAGATQIGDRTAGNPCDARQSEHTLCLAE